MADMEKVIRGLKCITLSDQNGTCDGCAYFRPFTDDPGCGWCDSKLIMRDALALLKEQEPVEPERMRDCTTFLDYTAWNYVCGVCHGEIDYRDKFCRHCGRAVKWE